MRLPGYLTALAWVLASAGALPATAQSAEELQQQLEAQKALNDQMRRRIEELERRLADEPPQPALRSREAPLTRLEPQSAESYSAIEEALVAKGLVLLPAGSFRIAPGFDWIHSGSESTRSRDDTFRGSLTVQAGLPWGMLLSANAPYVYRDTSIGSHRGVDDFSFGLSKRLNNESERLPSFVASLSYMHDNGDDPFERIPIGYGFRVVNTSLSAVKSVDPVALYGGVSYSYTFASDVSARNLLGERRFNGRIDPGDAWGYRLGASLAATPVITFDASLSGVFRSAAEIHSDARGSYTLTRSTVTLFNLGAGFILTRNLSLLLSASAGATKDSPDYVFSVSLPYRL